MPKSTFAHAVDGVQAALRPLLKSHGFKVRGRSFNAPTQDGLTEVVSIQMGGSDPPGTTYIPNHRENLHGLFTVNLGVYVPEVARHQSGGEAKSWIQDYHCCVRARLGEAAGERRDIWWHARAEEAVITSIQRLLEEVGLPFLARHSTRDKILTEWQDRTQPLGAIGPPRIVMAIILAERGQTQEARSLLAAQVLQTQNARHPDYVRKLAIELGLPDLDS